MPEGVDPLGQEVDYEDRYAIEEEIPEAAGEEVEEQLEEPLAEPIATAAIDLAADARYRTTGKRQYVDLAGYILHGDDRWKIEPEHIVYMFCGIPFTQRTKLEGHAVRAMYACLSKTLVTSPTNLAIPPKRSSGKSEKICQHVSGEGEIFSEALI